MISYNYTYILMDWFYEKNGAITSQNWKVVSTATDGSLIKMYFLISLVLLLFDAPLFDRKQMVHR